MRGTAKTGLLVLALATGIGWPHSARSGPPRHAKHPKASPAADAEGESAELSPDSLKKLRSDDPAEVQAGLDDARLVGPSATAAVPVIIDVLRAGLPYAVAESAVVTLGDLQSKEGAEAIAPYARHRDVKLRRAAVKALARSPAGAPAAAAAKALEAALSDPDATVRAGAATGLGSLRAAAAVPALFLALDHRVYEAAVSLGQLCGPSDCEAFVGRLGAIPFDVVTTGVDQILFRPASEVSDDAKVSIVARVRDLGSRDANRFLHDVQSRWPKGGSARVKREIDAAVLATLSSPGGGT